MRFRRIGLSGKAGDGAKLADRVFVAEIDCTLGFRNMVGSNTLRMQPNVRAFTMSSRTEILFLSPSSRKMHTTFDSFCFTHFARLCFFNSASIESVSPMHDAAWLTCPVLCTLRREKIKTAGVSRISDANG
jgi:hypothetical protein